MTSDMQSQVTLEMEMLSAGRRRYWSTTIEAEAGDRGHETSYSRVLIPRFFDPLVYKINGWLTSTSTGYLGKYRKLCSNVSAEQCAWFTLRAVFNALMSEQSMQTICGCIGNEIESELQFQRLIKEEPFLVKWLKTSMDKTESESVKFRRKRFRTEVKKHTDWNRWTRNEQIQVGAVMMNCFQQCSDIIEVKNVLINKHRHVFVVPSAECVDWITRHQEVASVLHHVYMPCIVEPKAWSEIGPGGYYSPELQSRVSFIKTRNKTSQEALSGANLGMLWTAANHIQETPWKINRKVLTTLRETWTHGASKILPSTRSLAPSVCPVDGVPKEQWTEQDKRNFVKWKQEANLVHRAEKTRVSECLQFSRILSTASKFSDKGSIYFPMTCDFRGRMYATTAAFSPQGPDPAKALLQFASGQEINDEGYKWFLIHGANCLGLDKLCFADRISGILDLRSSILRVGMDPSMERDFWTNADSPWQFLAWCFEFTELHKQGRKFRSHLPIGMDGSCNGLQHFSAMFRDEIGGQFVNLVPGDRPADIYQTVADRVIDKLSVSDSPYAKIWLERMSRKVTKKPVMTLPYGATRQNCTLSIQTYALENHLFKGDEFKASLFLSPIVWKSIEEVVVKARQAMDWLKKVAGVCCQNGLPMAWTAPSGLPVVHARYAVETKTIKTVLYNAKKLQTGKATDRLLRHKQENGASPNFVHSLDASHMCFIMNRLKQEKINAVSAVHDSFGVHSVHVPTLNKIIREEFVRLYTEYNPVKSLQEYGERNGIEFPEPSELGGLDLNKVIHSEYFFH